MFMLRSGYRYEDGITSNDPTQRTTVHNGFAAGATFQTRFTDNDNTILSINYAYRGSDPFDGTHSLGIRLSI